MHIFKITIIFLIFFSFNPTYSKAADCSVIYLIETEATWDCTETECSASEWVTWTTNYFTPGPGINFLGTKYQLYITRWEWDVDQWKYDANYRGYFTNDSPLTEGIITDHVPQLGEGLELCNECDSSSFATACGGAEFVASTDLELCEYSCVSCDTVAASAAASCDPANVDPDSFVCEETKEDFVSPITELSFSYSCFDQGCNEIQAECEESCGGFASFYCEEEGGFASSTECVCDPCSLESKTWADSNCGGEKYLDWYDCDTNAGACLTPDCQDLYNDCLDGCGGQIDVFSCLDGVVSDSCVCVAGFDVSPTDDIIDGSNEDAVSSDPLDTDSDTLKKIADNTKAENDNLASIAAINTEGFNNLTDVIEKQTITQLESIDQQNEDDTLTTEVSQGILYTWQSEVEAHVDDTFVDVEDGLANLAVSTGFEDSFFAGVAEYLLPVFAYGECQEFVFEVPSLNISLVLDCELSDKIKLVLGFIFSIYTILNLTEILFTGIVPKGHK